MMHGAVSRNTYHRHNGNDNAEYQGDPFRYFGFFALFFQFDLFLLSFL